MSEERSETFWMAMIVIGSLLVLGLAGWGFHACQVADKATLGRAEQRVETKNWEESAAYRAGLRRDFDELLLSYAHAKTDDERAAVLAVMRHRAEGAPPELVPDDVKDLLRKNGGWR